MSISIDYQKEIESLIVKASRSEKSDDALKFSQAACNAANAIGVIARLPGMEEKA